MEINGFCLFSHLNIILLFGGSQWEKVEDKYAVSSLVVAGVIAVWASAGMISVSCFSKSKFVLFDLHFFFSLLVVVFFPYLCLTLNFHVK